MLRCSLGTLVFVILAELFGLLFVVLARIAEVIRNASASRYTFTHRAAIAQPDEKGFALRKKKVSQAPLYLFYFRKTQNAQI